MRPLRFLLLLGLFIVLPVVLTCVSLISSKDPAPESFNAGYRAPMSRFRALLSFTTPSSLFPPSAIISLTDDNTTSFLARPAAFGPSLPARGLSGQLWVGKGFGDESTFPDEDLKISGFELGCSDVPGWDDDHKNRPENGAVSNKAKTEESHNADSHPKSMPSKRDGNVANEALPDNDDGTDDHLHHPLPDSNPAPPEKPGEPASISNQDKSKPPTHADIESLQESADIAGKIVMLSRGGCGFLEKVKWAQRRGGVAVIVGDNEPGASLTIMYAKGDTSNVTIPAIFTSYYSAHLLSSLAPSEEDVETGLEGKSPQSKDTSPKQKDHDRGRKGTDSKKSGSAKEDMSIASELRSEKGWVQNVLSAVGLDDDESTNNKDSRRPPGSGNIDWVLQEHWDEDKPAMTSTAPVQKIVKSTSLMGTKTAKSQVTSTKKTGNDDFIIGVQDWRDTELIAPKSTSTQNAKKQKGKAEIAASSSTAATSSVNPTATALKGGSITPGSGEYNHQRNEADGQDKPRNKGKSRVSAQGQDRQSFAEKVASYFHHDLPKDIVHPRPDDRAASRDSKMHKDVSNHKLDKLHDHQGLWVTLTPASPSQSPFFDTLLVLVVSPLVTLTFVYGLLLLRSRIRRRRWRAPKSIVERLPVRTYQTMSMTSSTGSSTVTSPLASTSNSPSLRPTNHSRVRPRSQTTTGVLSSSPSTEKTALKSSPKRKRYTGRQVECVVCLEEYVDGESQVMSLPCGHEFHAECITPWLVTRRRTCPICKGDVVRSLARSGTRRSRVSDDAREEDEQTSDDVQEQAATTENQDGSAAIPIPVIEEGHNDNDIEQGNGVETPLLGSTPRVQQGRWRGLLNGSLGRLSGDTVWRSSVNDRTR